MKDVIICHFLSGQDITCSFNLLMLFVVFFFFFFLQFRSSTSELGVIRCHKRQFLSVHKKHLSPSVVIKERCDVSAISHALFPRITVLDRCILSLALYAEEVACHSPTMLLVEKFV